MSQSKPNSPSSTAARAGTGTLAWNDGNAAAASRSVTGVREGADALGATLAAPLGSESGGRDAASLRAASLDAASLDAASLDITLAAPSVGISAASLRQTLARSTVLPRLEAMKSGGSQLVHNDRARYEHEHLLGQGGVGEVVRVKDHDIDRTVAVKRLRADMREASSVARFVEEIRTVGQLEHPNIVPIHDVGVDEEGQYFFVMKYVEGETVEAIIEKLAAGDPAYHQRYTQERRVEIFLGILDAIHYAHARGIIHRDIKPANIMVGPYGEVVVMDWGLAKRVKADTSLALPTSDLPAPLDTGKDLYRTRAGTLLGTPAYMSPEQARAEATLDERSDVYSLCVVFHELLGLHHYLAEQTTLATMLVAIQQHPAKHISFVQSPHQHATGADLGHFVAKGLEKDPKDRYQSVGEMIARLQARADGDIPIQCPVTGMMSVTRRLTRFIERHPYVMVGLLALFVLGTVAGAGYVGVRVLGG